MENTNIPRITIPAINIDNPSGNSVPERSIKRTSFALKGVVKVGENPIDIIVTSDLTDEGSLEETIVKAGICAGDGRVFRSDSDAASVCLKCGYALCHECAVRYRCAVCGRQACPHCGHDEDGEFYCSKCF